MSTASSILAAKSRYRRSSGIAGEMTLHCSSFSKCLVPGFRIGWVAAGKQARRIQQLQLMSTLSTSSPMQLAPVDYLSTKRYDAHLRRLRRQLAGVNSRHGRRCCAICRRRSSSTTATAATFCGSNYRKGPTLVHLAPGRWRRTSALPGENVLHLRQLDLVFRFNTARGWGTRRAGGEALGELIREQLA